jgi:heme/copper-type cytochrome/quinol oxidase subunit 1
MLVFVLAAPAEYFIDPAGSQEARDFFMNLKWWGGGLGPIVVGLAILFSSRVAKPDPVAARGLNMSIFLFGLGGLISLTLQGQDTRVPAHYHGVIGAVTLGFMTYALKETARAGWLSVPEKWQMIQVTLYGVGQSVFAAGLFIGGLAGLPRKTFGAAQELDSVLKKAGMGIMGVGGLLAVAGGVMFVVFMLKSFYPGEKDAGKV